MAKLKDSEIQKHYNKQHNGRLELYDGNNLFLMVMPSGSCIFKFTLNINKLTGDKNKRQVTKITLGKYPALTLAEARKKAIEYNQLVDRGIDPREQLVKQQKARFTVKQLADLYIEKQAPSVRTKSHSLQQFKRAVYNDIVAHIGEKLIIDVDDEIIRSELINPKINNGSPSTARRIRTNLKILFDYAIDEKIIKHNPVSTIKADRIYQDKPRERYLKLDELGLLLGTVYSAPIQTRYKIAIHLIAMLLPRKMELLGATWEQLNWSDKTFTITNTKMGNDLLIKLPTQAIKLFKILHQLAQGSNYIFPARNNLNKAISHNTINYMLHSLAINGLNDVVVHDLRRTGATNLGELDYPTDIIEVALNHSRKGIKKVYHRTEYLEQRAVMLQHWANKLDELIPEELKPYDKYFII